MEKNKVKILKTVRPQLADLELKRKEVLAALENKKATVFTAAAIGVFLAIFCGAALELPLLFFLGPVGIFVGAIYFLEHKSAPVREKLNQSIGDIIIKAISPGWSFRADKYLPAHKFRHLGLFKRFENINGENLVNGQHGKTHFAFSYLDLTNRSKNGSRSIFSGLVLIADFHKDVKGKTLVFPDEAQHTLGSWLGKKVQEFGWKGLDLVYLEDPVFEKAFAVYSSDQVEARYILTPSMMENLLRLSRKYDNRVSYSFTNGMVCVAIDGLESFQNDLNAPILADGILYKFIQPIEIVTEIIDILNLNTRIWAKE